MEAAALDVLYEDNHCLAIAKPAGVPSTHYDGGEETIDRAVKSYLKAKYQKPGNVFLGIVHRLDKPTSGVLLFARTGKSAARLAEQFREGAVEKIYWAVVAGIPAEPDGRIDAPLQKQTRKSGWHMEIDPAGQRAARGARHRV